jgi:hypothetical protein
MYCMLTAIWWKQWLSFFFHSEVEVTKNGEIRKYKVCMNVCMYHRNQCVVSAVNFAIHVCIYLCMCVCMYVCMYARW